MKLKSHNLLNKNIQQLLLYTLILFIIAIPVFYLIIEQLYIKDVDDAIYLKRDELRIRVKNLHTNDDINTWLLMDDDVKLGHLPKEHEEKIYFTSYLDSLSNEIEPYRELETNLTINGKSYQAKIRTSLLESSDLIIGIAEAQVILLSLLLLGWILMNRFISKKLWFPFYSTLKELHNYEINKTQDINNVPTDIKEFSELNAIVRELIRRNRLIYQQQKKFIENAAHEMQTPLAIMQSKLELMIEEKPIMPGQIEIFSALNITLQHLKKLNQSLLLLSKIENQQYEDNETMVLSQILEQVIKEFFDIINLKQVTLITAITGIQEIKASRTLLTVLLMNLISNAINHNVSNGIIEIKLTERLLTIGNSGKNFPLNENGLFQRFHKDKSNDTGVGLGLAIAKEICENYQWKIHYKFKNDMHFFFVNF